MFLRLLNEWGGEGKLTPRQVADKVIFFHHTHFLNRHKQTVATPAYHVRAVFFNNHLLAANQVQYRPSLTLLTITGLICARSYTHPYSKVGLLRRLMKEWLRWKLELPRRYKQIEGGNVASGFAYLETTFKEK